MGRRPNYLSNKVLIVIVIVRCPNGPCRLITIVKLPLKVQPINHAHTFKKEIPH